MRLLFCAPKLIRVSSAMLCAAVLIAAFVLPANSYGQQIGDRVVVTANFETKLEKRVVDRVFEGSIHTIVAVNGKWCYLDDVQGWLPIQNVMNLDMAMKHFTKRIKENDKDSIAWAVRGTIYHDLEQYGLAFNDLNRSLTINRENPVTWLLRGMVLKAQNKLQLAAKDFNQSIELNPKLANAHFNIGLVFYAMHDYEQAVKAFDKAIELEDKHALWFVSRGSAKLGLDDLDGARKDYLEGAALNKRLADAFVGLSNIALIKEDYEKAYEHAEYAVDQQPKNAMALNARGWVLFKLGRVDEAIYDLSRAIRFAPRLSIAYGNRGVCYVSKNEFDKAIEDHSRHIELDSSSPFALANRGVAWFGKGEFAKAKEDFEAAEKLAPELDETLNGYAWFLATCPDKKFRDGKLALEKATSACKVSEFKDWYQVDTLATAHAELGDFEKAVEWAEKALEIAPESKKKLCQEQLARFKRKEPLRSKAGKNAEQNIVGS